MGWQHKSDIWFVIGIDQRAHHTVQIFYYGHFLYGAIKDLLIPPFNKQFVQSLSCQITKIFCTHTSLKPQECSLALWRTSGIVCILITWLWTLSLLQVECGSAVSIHCFLVFQWPCRHVELVHNFSSLATVKVVLMLGDGIGIAESPLWLFMESSWKTKSIRLGTVSHGYWLSVSGYEAGLVMQWVERGR